MGNRKENQKAYLDPNELIMQTLPHQNELLMGMLTTNTRKEEVYFLHDFTKSLSVFNGNGKLQETADWLKKLCGAARLNR